MVRVCTPAQGGGGLGFGPRSVREAREVEGGDPLRQVWVHMHARVHVHVHVHAVPRALQAARRRHLSLLGFPHTVHHTTTLPYYHTTMLP